MVLYRLESIRENVLELPEMQPDIASGHIRKQATSFKQQINTTGEEP